MFAKTEREKIHAWRSIETVRNRWERALYQNLRGVFNTERKKMSNLPELNMFYVNEILEEMSTPMFNVLTNSIFGMSKEIYPLTVDKVEKSVSQYETQIMRWLSQYGLTEIKMIDDTTRAEIQKIINTSIGERWSLNKTALEIDKLYLQQIIPNRSYVIARTEIAGASNLSSQMAMNTVPVRVMKEWTTARDTAVRDNHMVMEGVIVESEEYFQVPMASGGIEMLLVPAHPSASPENRINCRCMQTYQKA